MSSLRRSSGFRNQTRALLSIRHPFATAILRGEKRYEFRRCIFSRHVDVVLVYVTKPVHQVVGEFDVLSIITASPGNLWRRTREYAGIDKAYFDQYFQGLERAHAIAIGDVRPYDVPFCPTERLGLRPPQCFAYVGAGTQARDMKRVKMGSRSSSR